MTGVLRRAGRLAGVASVFVMLLGVPVPGRAADKPIQPGAVINAPHGCTFNFVFRDANRRLYIGTAGHCVDRVGQVVTDGQDRGVGTVVYRRQDPGDYDDFALIRIYSSRYGDVNPAVRHWGGPTGYTTHTQTATGDRVLLSGYGMIFDLTSATRPRPGVLVQDDHADYRTYSPSIFGDSGGPVLHEATGKALGVVSGFIVPEFPQTISDGPTVARALYLLKTGGIKVSLVTAPYGGGLPI